MISRENVAPIRGTQPFIESLDLVDILYVMMKQEILVLLISRYLHIYM